MNNERKGLVLSMVANDYLVSARDSVPERLEVSIPIGMGAEGAVGDLRALTAWLDRALDSETAHVRGHIAVDGNIRARLDRDLGPDDGVPF